VDRCDKPHNIYVFSKTPFRRNPIAKLNPEKVGKHYNTREMIMEEINL
jgi:hypothetical protein